MIVQITCKEERKLYLESRLLSDTSDTFKIFSKSPLDLAELDQPDAKRFQDHQNATRSQIKLPSG